MRGDTHSGACDYEEEQYDRLDFAVERDHKGEEIFKHSFIHGDAALCVLLGESTQYDLRVTHPYYPHR